MPNLSRSKFRGEERVGLSEVQGEGEHVGVVGVWAAFWISG